MVPPVCINGAGHLMQHDKNAGPIMWHCCTVLGGPPTLSRVWGWLCTASPPIHVRKPYAAKAHWCMPLQPSGSLQPESCCRTSTPAAGTAPTCLGQIMRKMHH